MARWREPLQAAGAVVFTKQFALGIALSTISILLLATVIDWRETRDALGEADALLIGVAIALLLASVAAKSIRWRLLLPPADELGHRRAYKILHISFLLNNVLPARLGDVARVTMARTRAIRVGHILSSLLAERVADILTLGVAFLVVSPFLSVGGSAKTALWTARIGVGSIVALSIAAFVLRRRLSSLRLPARFSFAFPGRRRIADEARSFREGWGFMARGDRAFWLGFWTLAAWMTAFAINWALMRALHIDAPVTVAVLLTCATNLAMLLPSSPGYIGVFHAAATFSLLPFGVDDAQALSFAILAHLVNVLPVSLIGAAFLLSGRELASLRPTRDPEPAI